MKAVRTTIDAFDQTLQQALKDNAPVFVEFFGTEVPETNESWCPDCVISNPLTRKAILDYAPPTSVLLEAPVGPREEWKGNSSHPYRSRFGLTAIPTLVHWTQGGPGARLVEAECADKAKLQAFVEGAGGK